MSLLALALLALSGCTGGGTEGPESNKDLPSHRAARVEVVRVQPSTAALDMDLPGEVTGGQDALLAAANGGFIERVLVAEGEAVRKGQALVRIDVAMYAAQRDQAQAQADQAEADLVRVQGLGDLASQAQLTGAQTQLKVAQASLKLANTRLSRSVIKAPFAGTVATVSVDPGEAVGPGTPVVRVVQLDPIKVTLSVADRDVVALHPGLQVEVQASAVPTPYQGTISHVAPAADLRTRAFPVDIEVANPDHQLLPGMIARVHLEKTVAEEALVIPQDWLVTRRDLRGVFVVEEGEAAWRDVTLGALIHDQVVVLNGITSEDQVVINGHRDLVDGDELVVTREGLCCESGRPSFEE